MGDSIDNIVPHYGMSAGDGPHSYRGALDAVKPILEEEIAAKFDIWSGQEALCIADFGCSTGHNSFEALRIIIEAIKRKHESSDLKIPEFHVFFNDVVANDFNTLFSSLPTDRNYYVAAVPGDFHRRLLPPSSLHFAYSSWALMWLTEAPEAAEYGGDGYLEQFERDLDSFLKCRAVEMVDGGLMALLIPGVPALWDQEKEFTVASVVEPLRSCLVNMAEKGRLSKAKIESFKVPQYFPNHQQLRAILERSESFSIERMETLKHGRTSYSAEARAKSIRAALQTMIARHFGDEIIDELFHLYKEKLAASPIFRELNNDKTVVLLAILKRTNLQCETAARLLI
ncbi:hypothetical protein C2S53_017159 [Perilla frutescens var. hirtella]|uniref:Uncharacterized protein n=1 Tax=Perilla frutescens var. hirtella TaxID=608512 RepID=A0AAD4P6K4_PERFH|nr:hypothetical protein C2S53_017159 [Perilla frutescens var. hirtella]